MSAQENRLSITLGFNGKIFKLYAVDSYDIDLDMPVSALALPELGAKEAHTIKVAGNVKSTTLSFKLADIGLDRSDGDDIIDADQQRDYLERFFENKSINDSPLTATFHNSSVPHTKSGLPSKLLISWNAGDPLIYQCTITIVSGDVISSVEEREVE